MLCPATAVTHVAGEPHVFVVTGPQGNQSLRRVPVELSGQIGEELRIGGEPILGGEPIVERGTHVLADGESVQVTTLRQPR